jgi:uncharacterized protein (DUF697 family)
MVQMVMFGNETFGPYGIGCQGTFFITKQEVSPMTDNQLSQCHQIIHSHAAIAASGNLIPVPGSDFAVDTAAMTSMTMLLAGALGRDITEDMARNMVIVYLKRQIAKRVTKGIIKFIPVLGTGTAIAMSVAMIEGAGWAMVNELRYQIA